MHLGTPRLFTLVASLSLAAAGSLQAAPPETVPVGNPGNAADATGYGAVPYAFQIGKYEVTNAEYCDFLNAVAKDDPHDLYDPRMAHDGDDDNYGGIIRSGDSGNFTYTLREGMEKKPVNYVTVESCCRYANWLTNGQGKGDTEKGSYTFGGDGVVVPDHAELAKGASPKWVLASENEWYKAAYYDPNKTGGAGYWQFPGKGDAPPAANLNTNAPSDVGSLKDAASPYGTFDQGGNMWEYNDSQNAEKFGLRGGSFHINDHEGYMAAATRYDVLSAKWRNYGFRVVLLGSK